MNNFLKNQTQIQPARKSILQAKPYPVYGTGSLALEPDPSKSGLMARQLLPSKVLESRQIFSTVCA